MDEKALIILAEMLDKARIQANAIKVAETGVYGSIAVALLDTLILLSDPRIAAIAYQNILDGCSVDEALDLARAV